MLVTVVQNTLVNVTTVSKEESSILSLSLSFFVIYLIFSNFSATCEQGDVSCPERYHLVEDKTNPCCSTRVCVCDACIDPQPCMEGWTEVDNGVDECGCSLRQCKPPSKCIVEGVEHLPGTYYKNNKPNLI